MDIDVQRQEKLTGVTISFVVSDSPYVLLSHTCSRCGGYGSPCNGCNSGRLEETHTMASLEARIGSAATEIVATRLKNFLSRL